MITMKYSEFMGFGFTQGMQKLANQQFNPQTAYRIKKLADKMNEGRKKIQSEFQAIVDLYAKKDENGKITQSIAGDTNSFEIEESKLEEYKKAEQAFGEKEITFDRHPIHLNELMGITLSAGEISALTPVLVCPDEGDAAVTGNVLPMKA